MNRRSTNSGRLVPLSTDVIAILLLTLAVNIVVIFSVGRGTIAGSALGFIFLMLAPGYALIAALFPTPPTQDGTGTGGKKGASALNWGETSPLDRRQEARLGSIERLVLSVGASAVTVPLTAFLLNEVVGIQPVATVITLSFVTLVGLTAAVIQRRRLYSYTPTRAPLTTWLRNISSFFSTETGTDIALNILLVASIIVTVGGVGFASIAAEESGDTELALLAENETGDLVADGYPTTLQLGETESLGVSVRNTEGQPQEYTTVFVLQRVQTDGNRTTVTESQTLRTSTVRVPDGNTSIKTYDIEPQMTGDRLRLAVLLYRGTPPETPTASNAYRDVHLWISVNEDTPA